MIYKGHQIMEQCTVWPNVGKSYFVVRNEETKKWVTSRGKQARFKTEGATKQHIDKIAQSQEA